jgi:hypothetical protein
MAQKILYCFAHNSPEILLHVLAFAFCIEHCILADFCLMLLTLKQQKLLAQKLLCFGTKTFGGICP